MHKWFPYLAQAFVGRKISDVGDRGTPGYRREWQGAIRLKRVDMFWKVFGPVISFESGQIALPRLELRLIGSTENFIRFDTSLIFIGI